VEELCGDIERLTEGLVECHVSDIRANPDAFPCCVKCGELVCKYTPGFGTPTDDDDNDDNEAGEDAGMPARACGLVLQTASELCESKEGSAVELAAFQAAQEILRDKPCRVGIAHDASGKLHALVVYPDGTTKEAALEAVTRNPCACEVEE
jgi:hypothetical protein